MVGPGKFHKIHTRGSWKIIYFEGVAKFFVSEGGASIDFKGIKQIEV